MRVASAFFSVALVALAPSCAALWGFEDGTLATGGSEAGAGSADSAADAAPVEELPDADLTTPVPLGCETKTVQDAPGVYADAAGSDGDACGTEQAPCASLQTALNHAGDDAQVLYVGMGEYRENVLVPPALLARGFRIEGRWQRDANGQWLPFCVPGAESAVLIGGRDDAATLRAELPDPEEVGDAAAPDAGAPLANANLVLSSMLLRGAEVVPTRSSYSLYAANVSVELRASNLVAARGGDGNRGAQGAAGQGATGCGDGSPGAAGGAAPYGVFTRAGWSDPADSAAQRPSQGANGLCAGGVGVDCKNGGNGGEPGGSGQVGGASIAVYAWRSQLQLTDRSALHTVGGGAGGEGGPGGEGALGRASVCSGGAGGKGGAGGLGSPGAGGPSHCVILLTDSALLGGLPVGGCRLGEPGRGGDDNKGLTGASSAVLSP